MSIKDLVIKEIEKTPEPILEEVFDFIVFLKNKSNIVPETAILSESSLKKDWLKPEEDDAWAYL
ncbi:MAG TPA: DUF2281 domain-containing protein [Methanofastidiosum sp.]|mgnify:FL=1|nr:DUF2281 domain-containing protein [Methanofastidiosum sp.]